jgi:soluble lytic murein transglycosylase
MEYYDLAISTINQCSHKNDVPLRFPFAYQENILHHAKRHNVDPAWVFAVTRQESTFHTHSVSPVGARGLMQLMPTSASLLSKKHNIAYPSELSLHDPHVNVNLGSAYLKQLQNSMQDNVVLATASYNAGPSQIRKWLPNKKLDADIWIETIPYLETREYVKNVISLTSIYRHRLGQPPAFAKLMQPIKPKSVS